MNITYCGAESYAGGLDVPLVMGSRSTYMRAKIGGLNGRALVAGDRIPLGRVNPITGMGKPYLPEFLIPDYQSERPNGNSSLRAGHTY